jgi:PPOX class probable F420-dependent enzyme
MGIALNQEIRRLLDGRHFAVLATINPDGGPQTSAMWVGRDGDDVLFSTVAGRRKHRNLERDPGASVTVLDSEDPYNYVELRGRATIGEDVGRAFDTGLSWKYDAREPDPDPPGAVRLIVRMTVDQATAWRASPSRLRRSAARRRPAPTAAPPSKPSSAASPTPPPSSRSYPAARP